jgi:hypothetical protein
MYHFFTNASLLDMTLPCPIGLNVTLTLILNVVSFPSTSHPNHHILGPMVLLLKLSEVIYEFDDQVSIILFAPLVARRVSLCPYVDTI